jgi:uncharacterized membrane protein YkoI
MHDRTWQEGGVVKRKAKLIVGAVTAVAAIGIGTGIGIAGGGDDDRPLGGTDYDRATAAALEHVDGTVTETEVGDGGAAYEVEIRRPDGSQVEVQLDADFTVIGSEADDDGPNDRDGAGDD